MRSFIYHLYISSQPVQEFFCLNDPPGPLDSLEEGRVSFHRILSTLVISNSKGLSEILRDIGASTYQICRIEEKINLLTTFNKCMCNWTLEVRDLLKISSFPQYFLHVRFSCLGRDQIFTSR